MTATGSEQLTVTLSDLLDGVAEPARVPDPPQDAIRSSDGRDMVYDHRNRRWRYRDGALIGYIEYRDGKPVCLYGGDY